MERQQKVERESTTLRLLMLGLILFPLPIKGLFHASIEIPVGHINASLAEHFAYDQNGAWSLWSTTLSLVRIRVLLLLGVEIVGVVAVYF